MLTDTVTTGSVTTGSVTTAVVIDLFAAKRAQLSKKYGTMHPALLGPRTSVQAIRHHTR